MTASLDHLLNERLAMRERQIIEGTARRVLELLNARQDDRIESDALLSTRDVCRRLGIGTTTLWKMRREGAITPVYLGRAVRFRAADVEALQQRGVVLAVDP